MVNGPLLSAQIAVAKGGHVAAFETFGDARPSTRYITQSAGRPSLGACVWKLMSDGQLDVDQPVASVLAPFGSNGKEGDLPARAAPHWRLSDAHDPLPGDDGPNPAPRGDGPIAP